MSVYYNFKTLSRPSLYVALDKFFFKNRLRSCEMYFGDYSYYRRTYSLTLTYVTATRKSEEVLRLYTHTHSLVAHCMPLRGILNGYPLYPFQRFKRFAQWVAVLLSVSPAHERRAHVRTYTHAYEAGRHTFLALPIEIPSNVLLTYRVCSRENVEKPF